MMFNLFYRNFQLTLLTICLIIVWGLSSFNILPRLEDPVIVQRNAVITTLFPGARAERVETLVTEKIEEQLFEVEEINNFSSTSRAGVSIVEVRLKDTTNNVDEVWSKIRSHIEDAIPELPIEALRPEFENINTTANALLVGLKWTLDDPVNYAILGRLASQLEDDLREIKTTEKVETFGVPEEEIVVEANVAKLASLGLTFNDLSRQVLNSDAKVSAGLLRGKTNEILFEVGGELDTLERIRSIPIQYGLDGDSTVLGDIAQVTKETVSPSNQLSMVGGKPGVVIGARVERQQRIDLWFKHINKIIEQFRQRLPRGIELEILLDQRQYVNARLTSVIENLIIASFSVFTLTLLIMGWRSALVIGAALPLSVLMVFGWMNVLKIPLHQISVTGIIIALGLLVDNAIVVVDQVQDKIEKGFTPSVSVARSVRGLAIPLLASTLTTVLSFYPIASAAGSTGEFTGTIGTNVILALVSSLFLALTIIPALAGWIYSSRFQEGSSGEIFVQSNSLLLNLFKFGFSSPKLTAMYRWTLSTALAKPMLGISLALVLPIMGFIQFPTLSRQFFPPTDRDQFYIEFELPTQTPIDYTKKLALQARERILDHPKVDDVHWFIGESAPAFYYNVIEGESNVPYYGEALVQLKPDVAPRDVIHTLQDWLDEDFPEAQALVRQLEQGPPYDAPIELRIYGPDLAQLQQLGEQFRSELALVTNIIHTNTTLTKVEPKLSLNLDENQARLVGLSKTEVAEQLNNILEGVIGGSILESTQEIPVRVRIDDFDGGDLERVISLDLLPSQQQEMLGSSRTIPLSNVGHFDLTPSLSVIEHRNGQRVNDVLGFTRAGVLPSTVLKDFKAKINNNLAANLPLGFSIEFGGEAEAQDTAISNLISTIGVLVLVIISTLVLAFRSFWLAWVIIMVAGCAAGLSFGSLKVFDYPFGFTAILGMLGLIGLSINDSIVVLTALQNTPEACRGNLQVVREVVVRSSRHVITTTITTVVGLVPLLLDKTNFWPPLAVSISGGLIGTTIMALYFVPCVFLLLVKKKGIVQHFRDEKGTI